MPLSRTPWLAAVALHGAVASCAISDPLGPSTGGPVDAAPVGGDAAACGPPVAIEELAPCCDDPGGAHCLPDDQIPERLRASLDECPGGGRCAPDPLIAGDPPRPCTSIGNAPGACMSLCVPQVRNSADLLPTAGCEPSERCAPCVNPVDGTDTGACAPACSGDADLVEPGPDAGVAARCCEGAGACLPIAVVGDDAARLGVDVCASGDGLVCVPDVFLDGSFTPPPCSTGTISFLFGEQFRPGVCLPGCIPAVAQALFVGQDDCGTGFKCAPCLTPPGGQPSGACDPL